MVAVVQDEPYDLYRRSSPHLCTQSLEHHPTMCVWVCVCGECVWVECVCGGVCVEYVCTCVGIRMGKLRNTLQISAHGNSTNRSKDNNYKDNCLL